MERLLESKYNNALELISEMGRLEMQNIDDGDLTQLKTELKQEGYICELDLFTDYLVCTKIKEEETKKKYHYCWFSVDLKPVMDRKSKIFIPDFEVEMEFTDSGIYSSGSMEKVMAEHKLKDLIECYLADGRELPEPSEEDYLIDKYHEPQFWLHVEI